MLLCIIHGPIFIFVCGAYCLLILASLLIVFYLYPYLFTFSVFFLFCLLLFFDTLFTCSFFVFLLLNYLFLSCISSFSLCFLALFTVSFLLRFCLHRLEFILEIVYFLSLLQFPYFLTCLYVYSCASTLSNSIRCFLVTLLFSALFSVACFILFLQNFISLYQESYFLSFLVNYFVLIPLE
jgi:hypothetical protein